MSLQFPRHFSSKFEYQHKSSLKQAPEYWTDTIEMLPCTILSPGIPESPRLRDYDLLLSTLIHAYGRILVVESG